MTDTQGPNRRELQITTEVLANLVYLRMMVWLTKWRFNRCAPCRAGGYLLRSPTATSPIPPTKATTLRIGEIGTVLVC